MATSLSDLTDLIRAGSAGQARSQQRVLGPSEVGHPCLRKLAFGLMGEPRINEYGDPLPSVIGTGAHAMVEEFAKRNNVNGLRWLPETRVTVREGLSGTCDLYDIAESTVIDWKFPGTSSMAKYRSKGPSEVYRRQAHLYGRGIKRTGLPVTDVAICFLPRGGELKNAYFWSEPYSDEIVDETLARIDSVTVMLSDLDVQTNPAGYQSIPMTPGDCFFCPWHSSTGSGATCDGGTPNNITRLAS